MTEMDAKRAKQWKITETLLKRAFKALPKPANEGSRYDEIQAQFHEYIMNNEFELAFETLENLADFSAQRGGFWKDLIRAAENMGLHHQIPRLKKKFHDTPPRTGDK